MALTESQIQELYVAYFGRPADVEGKAYWSGSSTGITTVLGFAANMHSQSEFQDEFGSKKAATQVNQIYQNLFSRDADAAGLEYWTGQIANGSLQLAEIAVHLIWAAKNNDGGSADKTALENKVAAAKAFTDDVAADATAQLAYTADDKNAFTTAKSFISGVSSTAATAAEVDTQVAKVKTDYSTTGGDTFQLTTVADNIVGGSGNDTIKGVYDDDTAASHTFTVLDTINGGDGKDTLEVTYDASSNAVSLPGATISNVENFTIKNVSGQTGTFDFSSFTGEEKVINNLSTDVSSFTNLEAPTDVDWVGNGTITTANTTFGYTSSSTSSTIDLVDGVKGGTLTTTGTKLTSQTYTSTGAANSVAGLTTAATVTAVTIDAATKLSTTGASAGDPVKGTKVASLTIKGAGDVDINSAALQNLIATVDASASTGDVDVTTGNTDANTADTGSSDLVDLTVKTGSGNDEVDVSLSQVADEVLVELGAGDDKLTLADVVEATATGQVGDVFDGGEGTDTIYMASALATDIDGSAGATKNIKNFETVTISDTLAADLTLSNIQATGLTTLNLAHASAAYSSARSVTFNTGGGTVNLTNAVGSAKLTLVAAGSATDDAITLNRNEASTGTTDVFNGQAIDTTGVETLTIHTSSGGKTTTTQTLGAITLGASTGGTTKLVVKGAAGVDGVGILKAHEYDFSGMTGAFIMGATALQTLATGTTSTTITGGSGNDELVGDADQVQTIKGGAGNDTINGGSAVDTIYGGDGNDIIGGDSKVAVGSNNDDKDKIYGEGGKDTITLGGTALVTIDGGDGDDTVHVATNLVYGQSIKGGAGTDIISVTIAENAADGSVISEFETLDLNDVDASLDLDNYANNTFTTIDVGAADGMTISSIRNETLNITAAIAGDSTFTKEDATGSADSQSIKITASSNIDTGEELIIAGVETINIESDDTATAAANRVHTVDLQTNSATSIVVTGDSGLVFATLGTTDVADVTSMDASGVVLDKVTRTGITYAATYNVSGNSTTIKGSNGVDTLTGGAATDDTITAGSGADVLTYGGGADSYSLGAGNDHVNVDAVGTKTAHLVITDAAVGDEIDFTNSHNGNLADAALGSAVTLSSGTTASLDNYLDAATTNTGGGSTSVAKWFQFSGNTYVVLDNHNDNGYNAADTIVELTGLINLKTSEIDSSDVLTIA